MKKELFQRLSELEAQMKLFEEQRQTLRAKCLTEIEKAGVDKVESQFGTFTLFKRTSWKYPDDVKQEIVSIQDRAKESGAAEQTESKVLLFKPFKE